MAGKGNRDHVKDIALIGALKRHRADFVQKLIEASASQDADLLSDLRMDTMFRFAEFFYLIEALNLHDPAEFLAYVDRHNAYVGDLVKDAGKLRRMGLRKDRVLEAYFDDELKPRLLEQWKQKPGSIEQSNLARLLVTMMSTETVRGLIKTCEKARFMTRQKTVYGSMLVRSIGVIEKVYVDSLRSLSNDLTALHLPSPAPPASKK